MEKKEETFAVEKDEVCPLLTFPLLAFVFALLIAVVELELVDAAGEVGTGEVVALLAEFEFEVEEEVLELESMLELEREAGGSGEVLERDSVFKDFAGCVQDFRKFMNGNNGSDEENEVMEENGRILQASDSNTLLNCN